jgi:type II secretory pathway pseudopilin PulG
MSRSRRDAGFTLIELLVVVGMIVVVIGTLGVFFLGGPSPAVASAARDIDAAFAEARETAIAQGEATVVFLPAGTGFAARIYRQLPGAAAFAAVNGPRYESAVTIDETAARLGAPGFAFRVDSRGSVTGYANFTPSDTSFTTHACPASGAFVLTLSRGAQRKDVAIPCTISQSTVAIGIVVTPAPALTAPPDAPGTCAPSSACGAPLPQVNATCPPGYTPDATPNVCDSPTPVPPPTAMPSCPPGSSEPYPICAPLNRPSPGESPTPSESSTPSGSSYTVVATSGSHEILYVGWAAWAEVDVDKDGARLYEVCYGTATGQSVPTNGYSVAVYIPYGALLDDGIPSSIASEAIQKCAADGDPIVPSN